MKCPICGADLKYLLSEDTEENGYEISYFYVCTHCHKIITISDIELEEEE